MNGIVKEKIMSRNKFNLIVVLIAIAAVLSACTGMLPVVSVTVPEAEVGEVLNNQPVTNIDVNSVQSEKNSEADNPQSKSSDIDPPQPEPVQDQPAASTWTYTLVDTGQDHCYSDIAGIPCPTEGQDFYGQDAQYTGVQAQYVDNGNGTVTDLNTGLMWQQTPDLNDKATFVEAVAGADSFNLAGYSDWRLPTIKELYSLINFNGSVSQQIPYLDTNYFDFRFGDTNQGERDIDAQYWSSTEYVGTTMNGSHTVFGVNFADGRIKGYGTSNPRGRQMEQFVRYVRGTTAYGENDFVTNPDSTITDQATGLMWQQTDSGATFNWEGALNYCESLDEAGFADWRLPNAKELQSIVDYTRSPQTTNSAAIDPIFEVSETESWYWTSTTHLDNRVSQAVYVAFGQAFGLPNGNLIDVHGAGAQRSDPKSGDPSQYSEGRGSEGQEDQVRIYNYVRCVRNGVLSQTITGGEVDSFTGGRGPGTGNTQSQPSQENSGQGLGSQSGPPQAALDACSGLTAETACTIITPNGTLAGSCSLVPTGDLACVPEGGPPGSNQQPPSGGGQRP
jgi:hypothetical protein